MAAETNRKNAKSKKATSKSKKPAGGASQQAGTLPCFWCPNRDSNFVGSSGSQPGLNESAITSSKSAVASTGDGVYLLVMHWLTLYLTLIVTGRRDKTWNINTPKFHALGDYPAYIRLFGTTDSYSTQLVRT